MDPKNQTGNASEPQGPNPADPEPKQGPEPQQGDPAADPEPKQGPDDAQKLARIERERDSWKTRYEDLQKQLEDASKADDKAAEIERLKTEAATTKSDLEKQLADERKAARIDVMLASKRCRDIDMARSAIDMSKVTFADDGTVSGFDVEEFAKSKPFLFEPVAKVSTGAPASGGGKPAEAKTISEGLAAYFKDKE